MLAILDERDHANGRRREAAEPRAERTLVGTERDLLHPRDEALVVLAHAIELACRRGHRVDELEDRRPLAVVEDARDVGVARQALQHLEDDLRLRRLERGVRNARREMHRLADGMLGKERLVRREKFLDDVAVDLLALEVPHLLVAAEMRERVIRLTALVLGGERLA